MSHAVADRAAYTLSHAWSAVTDTKDRMTRHLSASSNAANLLLDEEGGSRMELVLVAAIIVSLGGLAYLAVCRLALRTS
jgi:hypothetical protein